jgi:hypothetical protein
MSSLKKTEYFCSVAKLHYKNCVCVTLWESQSHTNQRFRENLGFTGFYATHLVLVNKNAQLYSVGVYSRHSNAKIRSVVFANLIARYKNTNLFCLMVMYVALAQNATFV